MSDSLCRKAIESTLKTWATSRTPALPVAWQNVPFTTPTTAYLRAFLLPARTTGIDLAGTGRNYRGVYQISIMAPINTGPGAAEAIAGEIAALFPLDTILSVTGLNLQITSPVSIAQGVQSEDRYVVPVSFTYNAFTI